MVRRRHAPVLGITGALLFVAAACEPRAPLPIRDPIEAPVPDAGQHPGEPPPEDCASTEIVAPPARLLTRFEYDNTVRDLLGDDTRPASAFPSQTSTHGFDNNAEAHRANPTLVEAWLLVAEDVARRAVAERLATLLPCDPAEVEEAACAETFAREFGRRAFRRPLSDDELAVLLTTYEAERERAGTFEAGIEAILQVALLSPQFLYRLEPPPPGDDDIVPLDGYALASRLSYFFWGSLPDDALLDAAASGRLSTREGVEAEARRLLADARAKDILRHFHGQWLNLGALDHLVKDSVTYPTWEPSFREEQRRELERFIEHVWLEGEGTLAALLTSRTALVTPTSAAFYDVDGPSHDRVTEVELDPEQRAGLLTRAGLMSVLANPDQSSPILRGVFVRERLLCDVIPPPPMDEPIVPPDPDPNATTRERFAEHTSNERCAGCHALIDPVGFGFERYDGTGRYRSEENGLPIDASGALVGVEAAIERPFDGAVELSELLAGSAQVESCVATQWFRFAHGRVEMPADRCVLDDVRARFSQAGGDLKELLVGIATSDAFRFTKGGAP